MALTRRSTQRVSNSIWPGFVDAMTALLLVMMFVLTIFMVMQFTLREEISGQESELGRLSAQVAGLARLLDVEEARTLELTDTAVALGDRVRAAQALNDSQADRIAALEATGAGQSDRIAGFEAQVAALLAQRDTARDRGAQLAASLADVEAARETLMTEQEALQLALAQSRDEIDAGVERARLDAARREALEALTADLRRDIAAGEDRIATLGGQLAETAAALDAEEAARLTEAAAAEALRARLAASDAELTAMTLALEDRRAEAERTLTLLAAARAAEADLDDRLIAALAREDDLGTRLDAAVQAQDRTQADLAASRDALDDVSAERDAQTARLAEALSRETAAIDEGAALADALDAAQAARLAFEGDLDDARARLAAAEARVSQMRTAAGREADERDALAARLAAAQDEIAALEGVDDESETLRDLLETALADRLAAQAQGRAALSEAERQAALLSAARDTQARTAAESQREVEALNQQIALLRQGLSDLQAALDLETVTGDAADLRIEDLGTQLSAALTRETAQLRRQAELEAAERQRLERYQSEFFGRLRDLLGDREGVKVVGDRFVFSSEVLFPSGSAVLQPEGQAQIARVTRLLADIADDIPPEIDWVIRVDGHTDNVPLAGTGQYADNWELSLARALSVVRFMSDRLGFPERRLAPTGFGENRPLNAEGTPEGRAQNRRIELKLTER